MAATLGEQELGVLRHLLSGRDAFTGCAGCGDFGKRMLTLAALRRAGLIDRGGRITALGRDALARCEA